MSGLINPQMTLVNALSHSTDSGVGGANFSPPGITSENQSHSKVM
jgi:hypothetical protein